MPPEHRPHQFDLFVSPDGAKIKRAPPWQALPAEARQVLTQLMARLILDHADQGHAPEEGDVSHDS